MRKSNLSTRKHKKGVNELPHDLPIMLDADTCGGITNTTAKCIRDQCKSGAIRAVKVGRVWRIPRDPFLEQFGLKEDDAYVGK